MSKNILKQVGNAIAIGGLAAMVSGCAAVITSPSGNRLIIPSGAGEQLFMGIYNGLSVERNQNEKSYGGPVEARNPLGETRYSYPFLQYSGSGTETSPDNLLHKRAVISLSESDVVYFGTSWGANNVDTHGFFATGITSTSFVARNERGEVIYSEPEKLDGNRGKRVRWVGLDRETLRRAGRQIKVEFFVRNKIMRNKNTWGWPTQDDSYIVPIVP